MPKVRGIPKFVGVIYRQVPKVRGIPKFVGFITLFIASFDVIICKLAVTIYITEFVFEICGQNKRTKQVFAEKIDNKIIIEEYWTLLIYFSMLIYKWCNKYD